MQPIYCGIDPSLTGTGIALVQGRKLLSSDTLQAPKQISTGMPRLLWLRDATLHFVRAYDPVAVCVEGYSMGSRNTQAHKTGEWGGVLRLALYEAGYRVYLLPPKSLKKFATGNGNIEGKAPMAVALRKLIGVRLADREDEVDAALLALAIQERERPCLGLSDHCMSALNAVEIIAAQRTRPARPKK